MCVVKYMKDRYLGVVVYVGKAKFLSETTSIMFVCFIFITAVGRITEPHKAILLSIHIYFFISVRRSSGIFSYCSCLFVFIHSTTAK